MEHSNPRRDTGHRVLVHGLPYVGAMVARLMSGNGWEFIYYPDKGILNVARMAIELWKCDLVYQIGGRVTLGKFLRLAKWFGKEKVVVHWVGSDAIGARATAITGKSEKWTVNSSHHWAETDWMVREVQMMGIACERIPLPSTRVPECPSSLPDDFSVLLYVPDIRLGDLYGLDRILQVTRELPYIHFELVGLVHGPIPNSPPNLRIHGRVPDLTEFYLRSCVVWRPVRHDGLSFMVLEALGHGRHVLWSYDFPGCVVVHDAEEAREEILRLYTLHKNNKLSINEDGVRVISRNYLPQYLKQTILDRLQDIASS